MNYLECIDLSSPGGSSSGGVARTSMTQRKVSGAANTSGADMSTSIENLPKVKDDWTSNNNIILNYFHFF